jgi:MoxR-like ATPase
LHLQPVGDEPQVDPFALATELHGAVSRAVRGKPEAVRLALVALLSGAHLLVEDVPGTGKTLLAKSLAAACGGAFRRVQCTPDLLPADITGTNVWSPATGEWEFRAGPIFANVLLVDEINRASPRTQAALLEPMEEHQVTVDGRAYLLPSPFMCVATENPFGSAGTFALPESQLDRFGIVLRMGLPDRSAEREILSGAGGTDVLGTLQPVATPDMVASAIAATRRVHIAPPVLDYVLDLTGATRSHPTILLGASPRASRGLLHAAQAHAVLAGRAYVSPDDVQQVLVAALAHRVVLDGGIDATAATSVLHDILTRVPVPRP